MKFYYPLIFGIFGICLIVLISFAIAYPRLFLADLNAVKVTAVVPLSETSMVFSASAGGASSTFTENNNIIVTAPENFTSSSSEVTIKTQAIDSSIALSAVGNPAGDFKSASSVVFNVKAFIDSKNTTDAFDKPIMISFHYSGADMVGLDESTLGIYHYHKGAWEKLDDCVTNIDDKTITCTTMSFSMFALFAKLQNDNSINSNSSISVGGSIGGGGRPALISQNQVPFPLPLAEKKSSVNINVKNTIALFKNNLAFGNLAPDVKILQQFLNSHGYAVSLAGMGSLGHETIFFGPKTRAALIKFQEDHFNEILKPQGLKKGTGIFGKFTQMFVNNMLSK